MRRRKEKRRTVTFLKVSAILLLPIMSHGAEFGEPGETNDLSVLMTKMS